MIPLYDQNPTEGRPVLTRLLIYANVLVFLATWWMISRGVSWIAPGYGMVPARLSADPPGEAVKLLTSTFLHAGPAHLGWNMLFLHIFGDNVEEALGKIRFLLFYCLAGVAGGLAQYAVDPYASTPLVGASGAIAGVLGAYMVLYPRAPVVIFNPLIFPLPLLPLPAWLVVGWWFVTNLAGGFLSFFGASSQIAYMAHLGGFALGLLATRLMIKSGHAHELPINPLQVAPRRARRKLFPHRDDGPFWR